MLSPGHIYCSRSLRFRTRVYICDRNIWETATVSLKCQDESPDIILCGMLSAFAPASHTLSHSEYIYILCICLWLKQQNKSNFSVWVLIAVVFLHRWLRSLDKCWCSVTIPPSLFFTGSNQPPRFLNYFFSTYLLIYEDMPVGECLRSASVLPFDASTPAKQSTVKLSLWIALSTCLLHRSGLSSAPAEYKLRKRKQQVKRHVRMGVTGMAMDVLYQDACAARVCMCVACLSAWRGGSSRARSSDWYIAATKETWDALGVSHPGWKGLSRFYISMLLSLLICCAPLPLGAVEGYGINTRHGYVRFLLLHPLLFIYLFFVVIFVGWSDWQGNLEMSGFSSSLRVSVAWN